MTNPAPTNRPGRSVSVKHLMRKTETRLGSITLVFDELTKNQKMWIIEQTIRYDCSTAAEFIAELIRDAYAEAGHDE